jgi:spore coat protein A
MSSRFFSSRRAFLRHSGLALAGLGLETRAGASTAGQAPELDPGTLTPFVDRLPIPALARAVSTRPNPENPHEQIPYYRIAVQEERVKIHRDLPATRMWCFDGSFPGPTIETQSRRGMIVEWENRLPAKHFLPVDHTLHGAEAGLPEGRMVVHLHGGRTPADSDGYPEDWKVAGQTQTCFYPSAQEAALLFYHDHSMGINRLNIYAGMQGLFIVRDPREEATGIPTREYEIPLMIVDRQLTTDGQLLYPVSPDPKSPWVPEVFGNAILANGKLLPYHEVQPRKYRLRLMNGSNARFYRFGLSDRSSFQVIANDQGLLGEPVTAHRLVLAPAERGDMVVDFAPFAGKTVRLVSDTFDIVQFHVGKQSGANISSLSAVLHQPLTQLKESDAVRTRRLTLDERLDGVQQSMGMLLNMTPWHAPVTERPELHTTEIWELVNLTEDTHPIHLHLVRFQILDRRTIDPFGYYQKPELRFTGPAMPPEPFESGWKDTVRADAGTVTRIIIPFEGYAGRYVWHCHILEHEDNEMMRPYEVLPPGAPKA